MIVKNEEAVLGRSLASASGLIDELIVVDTGSTDRTKEVVSEFAAGETRAGRLSLGYKIIDFEWSDDFSSARNAGLSKATGEWILQLDADEELIVDGCSVADLLRDKSMDAYGLTLLIPGGSQEDNAPIQARGTALRLFRRRDDFRYRYPVHEQIILSDYSRFSLCGLSIYHWGALDADGAMQAKRSQRNIRLLSKAVSDRLDPGYFNSQLGQEYLRINDFAKAYACFREAMASTSPELPYVPEMLRSTAWCLYNLGYADNAFALLNDAKAQHPFYTDYWFLEGYLHKLEGRSGMAEELLVTCLKMGDPKTIHNSLGGTGSVLAQSVLESLRR